MTEDKKTCSNGQMAQGQVDTASDGLVQDNQMTDHQDKIVCKCMLVEEEDYRGVTTIVRMNCLLFAKYVLLFKLCFQDIMSSSHALLA